jgi:hypothetical protein
VFAAGIVKVVLDALEFVTVAPDQLWNCCPEGAALAEIGTTVPAAYEPLPVPFTTVNV